MKPSTRRPLTDRQPAPSDGRRRGIIARKIQDRGFCFIRDTNGVEYFCHMSALPPGVFTTIEQGQPVEFSEEESAKGPRATDVTLI
jgi:cold shock CspA family protein